ncbi:MAG: adenylate cyclase [Caldimonas sp.]
MNLRRLLSVVVLAVVWPLAAEAAVSISVNIAPPPLPVYVQPPIPGDGYLWTPGYWRWDPISADYFWVPGTWVAPPAVGLLWTPGWWGWGGGGYLWHGGYWGSRVGFYGGVNYGYGYIGSGYHGGYWRGGVFNYNRSVNNLDPRFARNVYNAPVVDNRARVSFNGGQGGLMARPDRDERLANAEHHFAPTSLQQQHERVAMSTPGQRASFNHGAPTLAAMPRPGGAHDPGVTHAPEAMRGRPGQERPPHGVPPPRRELARGEVAPAQSQHDRRGDRPEVTGRPGPGPAQQQMQPRGQPQAHSQPQPQAHAHAQPQAQQMQPHVQQQPQQQGQPHGQAQPQQHAQPQQGNEHRGGPRGGERER